MAREFATESTLRGHPPLPRARKWRVAGLAVVGSGISLVAAATGAVYIEALNDLHTQFGRHPCHLGRRSRSGRGCARRARPQGPPYWLVPSAVAAA
jgi:hypothetical protein